MGSTTQRTIRDRAGGIGRMIDTLGRDRTEWDVGDLIDLAVLEAKVANARTRAVMGLRETGYTDGQLAAVLGISQQAVSKRWPGDGRYVGAAGRYRKPRETS